MTARWMQAKKLKQARERRAWAKQYSIKNSAGPNWHNGKIARDGSLDLGEEVRLRNEANTRKARVPDISEIRQIMPDAIFFSTPCDTPYHRCRLFYNPKTRSTYILQYVIWDQHIAKLSFAYPTAQRAWQAFITKQVMWRKTLSF